MDKPKDLKLKKGSSANSISAPTYKYPSSMTKSAPQLLVDNRFVVELDIPTKKSTSKKDKKDQAEVKKKKKFKEKITDTKGKKLTKPESNHKSQQIVISEPQNIIAPHNAQSSSLAKSLPDNNSMHTIDLSGITNTKKSSPDNISPSNSMHTIDLSGMTNNTKKPSGALRKSAFSKTKAKSLLSFPLPSKKNSQDQDNLVISVPSGYRNILEKGIFMVPLGKLSDHNCKIPLFVEQVCLHIEQNYLDQEGIFRRGASTDEVKRIRDTINNGVVVDFWTITDCHVICSLLKLYLRELPDPLLTNDLYSTFLDKGKQAQKMEPDELIRIYKELINKLPSVNKFTLKRILIMLNKVVDKSQQNKMDASNLGKVFGQCLLRPIESNIQSEPKKKEKKGRKAGSFVVVSSSSDRLSAFGGAVGLIHDAELVNEIATNLIKHFNGIFVDVDYRPFYLRYVISGCDVQSKDESELDLGSGDYILVTSDQSKDKWIGECNGKSGHFSPLICVNLDGGPCV
eukprot:TRINITY_DN4343_c0_g1_i3.p1 TRINITY_DN4343_c0_g1~~TRINITY_DN4343_c0_g1_i3.p1  ORF type:complete len:512 (-),score=68.88 TRINITY_DN4343_c0_g1_i3:64-1599(-)